MAKVTDNRLGVRVDIVAAKDRDFDRRFHAQFYSGTTLIDFEFTNYSGASLQVRRKPNSPIVELSFTTVAGSISFDGEGRFTLQLGYADMNNLRSGVYDYDMYLSNTTYPKRDFMYGEFEITERVTR